MMQTMQNE